MSEQQRWRRVWEYFTLRPGNRLLCKVWKLQMWSATAISLKQRCPGEMGAGTRWNCESVLFSFSLACKDKSGLIWSTSSPNDQGHHFLFFIFSVWNRKSHSAKLTFTMMFLLSVLSMEPELVFPPACKCWSFYWIQAALLRICAFCNASW